MFGELRDILGDSCPMKNYKRALWATVTISGLFLVPPIMLNVLSISPNANSTVWLFSNFPWTGIEPYWLPFSRISSATFPKSPTMTAIFMAFLCELGVLTLLNVQLIQRLQKTGESPSKALLQERPSLPSSS